MTIARTMIATVERRRQMAPTAEQYLERPRLSRGASATG